VLGAREFSRKLADKPMRQVLVEEQFGMDQSAEGQGNTFWNGPGVSPYGIMSCATTSDNVVTLV
jgi:hypothetical protein